MGDWEKISCLMEPLVQDSVTSNFRNQRIDSTMSEHSAIVSRVSFPVIGKLMLGVSNKILAP